MKFSTTFYHNFLILPISLLLLTACSENNRRTEVPDNRITSLGPAAIQRSDANTYGTIGLTTSGLSIIGEAGDESAIEKMKRLEEEAGLAETDIIEFTLCGTMEDISLSDITAIADEKKVPVNMAVSLAKSIDYAQMKTAMQVLNQNSDPNALYEDTKIEQRDVLKITPSEDVDNPRFVTMANDGKTLYVGMSKAEIIKTLHHEISGQPEKLSIGLADMYAGLTNEVPIRMVMLVPEAVRENITDKYEEIQAEGGLAAAMMGGMYTPFTNMLTLAITGDLDAEENMDLSIVSDLGSEKSATKGVAAMALITGLIQGLIPADDEGNVNLHLAQSMKTHAEGKYLVLEMKVPKEELE